MDLFLALKPDQMSPDGKEHVIWTLSRIRDIGQEIHDRGGFAAMQANLTRTVNGTGHTSPSEFCASVLTSGVKQLKC